MTTNVTHGFDFLYCCLSLDQNRTGRNTCFQNVHTPGCLDEACADAVCQEDDFCCKQEWDKSCVDAAMQNIKHCQQDWPKQNNSCFEADPFDRPRCNEPNCEKLVCTLRPECCDEAYNGLCVSLALTHCELPTPVNTCYATSGVPGCNDTQCLDVVCDIDETCCSMAYSEKCVDIAKKHAVSCPPPEIGNTCLQESPFGGCLDKRCEQLVCEISASCCNGAEAGQWSSVCVRAAKELCQPAILPR
jgi:hypothetical protein